MNFRRCFPPSAIDNCSYMYMYLYVSLVLLYVTLWVKTDCCANFCDSLKLSTWHKDIEDGFCKVLHFDRCQNMCLNLLRCVSNTCNYEKCTVHV